MWDVVADLSSWLTSVVIRSPCAASSALEFRGVSREGFCFSMWLSARLIDGVTGIPTFIKAGNRT